MELHPNNVEAVDLFCNSLDSMAVSKSESRLFAGASNQHRGSIGLNLPSLLFFFAPSTVLCLRCISFAERAISACLNHLPAHQVPRQS